MSTENISEKLAAADDRNGFPAGTMASILQQETGGNKKYLQDPTAYHYGLNAEGKRVAGHTGKISTAFGPFGILESTAKDPGYGVAPLKDKSLDEQVRFASDYLAARSKGKGGLVEGLAGYGEGTKYAEQVMGRIKGGGPVVAAGASTSRPAPAALPAVVDAPAPVEPVMAAAPVLLPPEVRVASGGGAGQGDAWQAFLNSMPKSQPVQANDLRFGSLTAGASPFQFNTKVQSARPNFEAFTSWTGRSA